MGGWNTLEVVAAIRVDGEDYAMYKGASNGCGDCHLNSRCNSSGEDNIEPMCESLMEVNGGCAPEIFYAWRKI